MAAAQGDPEGSRGAGQQASERKQEGPDGALLPGVAWRPAASRGALAGPLGVVSWR